MGFAKLNAGQKPGKRPAGKADDPDAEGLLDGEEAIKLDSGHYVAIGVDEERLPNGEGVVLKVRARWIEGSGKSRKDPHGREVDARSSHTISAGQIQAHGLDAMRRQAILLALGEDGEEFDVKVDPTAPAPVLPEGHWADPTARRAKILPVKDDVRLAASVRNAIKLASEVTPRVDVAASLKL